MNARFVAIVAGVGFFFLAVLTQGILPFVERDERDIEDRALVSCSRVADRDKDAIPIGVPAFCRCQGKPRHATSGHGLPLVAGDR
jgi:hypothetical protein